MEPNPIIYDQWLTSILQRDCYRLALDDDLVLDGAYKVSGLLKDVQAKSVFLYAKVKPEALPTVRFLEQSGFHLIDTNVVLDKPITSLSNYVGNCKVRLAMPGDENQVADLARRSFVYSRFHLDDVIPDHVANTIKAEWARNYFLDKRGDQMVVALIDDEIVGFNQLLYSHDKMLIIDLIAVDIAQHRKGIASDMMTYAEAQCQGFDQIRVGTQLANVPSLRLYEKAGFRVSGAQYVFHYHRL